MQAAGIRADLKVSRVLKSFDEPGLEEQRQVVGPARVREGRRRAVGVLHDDALGIEGDHRGRVGQHELRVGKRPETREILRDGQVVVGGRRLGLAAGEALEALQDSVDAIGVRARRARERVDVADGVVQRIGRCR